MKGKKVVWTQNIPVLINCPVVNDLVLYEAVMPIDCIVTNLYAVVSYNDDVEPQDQQCELDVKLMSGKTGQAVSVIVGTEVVNSLLDIDCPKGSVVQIKSDTTTKLKRASLGFTINLGKEEVIAKKVV